MRREHVADRAPCFRPGQWLFRRPRHSGFVGATWTWSRLSADLNGVFVGRFVDSDFASLGPADSVEPGLHDVGRARSSYQLTAQLRALAVGRQPDRTPDYMEPLGYPATRPQRSALGCEVGFLTADGWRSLARRFRGAAARTAAPRWPARVADFDVVAMVTMFDEEAARSRSHGLRPGGARRAGRSARPAAGHRPLHVADLRRRVRRRARRSSQPDGVTHVVFGDILFDEHRRWAERDVRRARPDRGRTAVRLVDRRALSTSGSRRGADARHRDGARGVPR